MAVAEIDDDTVRVLCRSTLPCTLDLVGSVRWRLPPESGGTRLDLGQEVEVGRPELRGAPRGVRPLLEWDRWSGTTG